MGLILAGALAGGGAALQQFGLQMQHDLSAENLERMREEAATARQNALFEAQKEMQKGSQAHDVAMVGVRETSRQQGRLADIEQDTNPDIIAKKGTAASGLIRATLPARVEEKTALGQAEIQLELDKFQQLAPVKRQAAIDDALAVLAAKSTPEALKQARAIKQAEHIVDPSYTLIPNSDGTVTTFDAKSGKSGGQLKGADGEPIVRKDPEELKAATAVINMATTNLKIAQAEHKATMADIGATPAEKAAVTAAWKSAQEEAHRLTAPAYAVLYSKAKMPDAGTRTGSGVDWSKFIGGNTGGENTATGLPLATEPPGTPNPDIGDRSRGLLGRKKAAIATAAQAEAERRKRLEEQGAGYGMGY